MYGKSLYSEKQEPGKGSTMLYSKEEDNQNEKEKDELFNDLKDSYIKFTYDIEKLSLKYEEIKIGKKKIHNINEIGNNGMSKFEEVGQFIDFIKEMRNITDRDYNGKKEFTLELEIKGDKNRKDCILECLYKLTTYYSEKKQYKDFNILINGPSDGFLLLLDDLNS